MKAQKQQLTDTFNKFHMCCGPKQNEKLVTETSYFFSFSPPDSLCLVGSHIWQPLCSSSPSLFLSLQIFPNGVFQSSFSSKLALDLELVSMNFEWNGYNQGCVINGGCCTTTCRIWVKENLFCILRSLGFGGVKRGSASGGRYVYPGLNMQVQSLVRIRFSSSWGPLWSSRSPMITTVLW